MSYWETLLTTQGRPDLPDGERRDVNQLILGTFLKSITARDLAPADGVKAWVDHVNRQDNEIAKAVVLNPTTYRMAHPYPDRREGHKSILTVNDLVVMGPAGGQGWAEKPALHSGFEFLRYFVENVDLLQAIIITRQRQVAAFCRLYNEHDGNPLGYRYYRLDGEKLTKDDQKELLWLDQVLQNSGTEFDPRLRRWKYHRRTFSEFVQAFVYDTLSADACPIETELTRGGELAGWYGLPYDTVRLAFEQGYQGNDAIVAVQVAPEELAAVIGYEADEIVFEVRNPRTSLVSGGYGQSENECLVRAITSYLNTCTYNAAALDRNSIPRGFLTLFGDYNQTELDAFKANWNALMRGAAKRFGLPVLTSKRKGEGGAQYTPVDTANAEMFMVKWLTFIGSMATALHGMTPDEINLDSFTAKASTLSGDDTSEKLKSSHDRGLIPLMGFVEATTNGLLRRVTKKYGLTWMGLYPEDEARKHERQKLALTINEVRAIDAGEPHPNPQIGEAPANPALMALYMAVNQIAPVGAQGQDDGAGDGDDQDDDGGADFDNALPDSEAPPRYARPGQATRASSPKPAQRSSPAARPAFAKGGPEAPRLIVEIRELPDEDVHDHL